MITDKMIDAGCRVRHGKRTWNRAFHDSGMTSWVQSRREMMRKILTAAIEAEDQDPNDVWEAYLTEMSKEGSLRSEQAALAFGYAAGRP